MFTKDLARIFNESSQNPQHYAKALSSYLESKSSIVHELLTVLVEIYKSDILYDDNGEVDQDILNKEWFNTPILVKPLSINNQSNLNDWCYVDVLSFAKAIADQLGSDNPDVVKLKYTKSGYFSSVADVLEMHELPVLELRSGMISTIEFTSQWPLNIKSPDESQIVYIPAKEPVSFDVNDLDWLVSRADDGDLDMLINPLDTFNKLAETCIEVTKYEVVLRQLSSNVEVSYSELKTMISERLSGIDTSNIDLGRDLLEYVSDMNIPVDERIRSTVSFLANQVDQMEDEASSNVYDDDEIGLTFNTNNYSGKEALAMWDSSTMAAVNSTLVYATCTIFITASKVTGNVIKAAFSSISRLWRKYVEPAYQSKDFVKSDAKQTDPYVDVPVFIYGDDKTGIKFDHTILSNEVYNNLNSPTTKRGVMADPIYTCDGANTFDEFLLKDANLSSDFLVGFSVEGEIVRDQTHNPMIIESGYVYVDHTGKIWNHMPDNTIDLVVVNNVVEPLDEFMILNLDGTVVIDSTTLPTVPPNSMTWTGVKSKLPGTVILSNYDKSLEADVPFVTLFGYDPVLGPYIKHGTRETRYFDTTAPFINESGGQGMIIINKSGLQPDSPARVCWNYQEDEQRLRIYRYNESSSYQQYDAPFNVDIIIFNQITGFAVRYGLYVGIDGSSLRVHDYGTIFPSGNPYNYKSSYSINSEGYVTMTNSAVINLHKVKCAKFFDPISIVSSNTIKFNFDASVHHITCTSGELRIFGGLDSNLSFSATDCGNQVQMHVPYCCYVGSFKATYRLKGSPLGYVVYSGVLQSQVGDPSIKCIEYSVSGRSLDAYYYPGTINQSPCCVWENDHVIVWTSAPFSTLSQGTIGQIYEDVINPIPNGTALTLKNSFSNVQLMSKDGVIRCVSYLVPIENEIFINSDGDLRFKYDSASGSMMIDDQLVDDDSFQDWLSESLAKSVSGRQNYDFETGDVQAYNDLRCSLMLLDMYMWCTSNYSKHLSEYFLNYINKGKLYVFGSIPTQAVDSVNNNDFISLIYHETINDQAFSLWLYNVLFNAISNKKGYMRAHFILTGEFPVFVPYVIGDRLLQAKWHINTDREIAQYVERVCATVIVMALVVATAISVGLTTRMLKRKCQLKTQRLQMAQRSDELKLSSKMGEISSNRDEMKKLKTQLNDLEKGTPEYDECLKQFEDSRAKAIQTLQESKLLSQKLYKSKKALSRWEKLTSFLGNKPSIRDMSKVLKLASLEEDYEAEADEVVLDSMNNLSSSFGDATDELIKVDQKVSDVQLTVAALAAIDTIGAILEVKQMINESEGKRSDLNSFKD